jgi:hypothetical protein
MNPNGFEAVAASPKLNPSSMSILFWKRKRGEKKKKREGSLGVKALVRVFIERERFCLPTLLVCSLNNLSADPTVF